MSENRPQAKVGSHEGALSGSVSSGILTIDLSAVQTNFFHLRRQASPALVGAVVKADAYGLDAPRIASALSEVGCRDFFVALLEEALCLAPSLAPECRLFVLGGLLSGTERICAEAGIVPVLNSIEQVVNWAALAKAQGRVLPAVLQVDTGMARLGLSEIELGRLREEPSLLEGVNVLYLMSHLACSDDPAHPRNADQLKNLQRVSMLYPGIPISLANSGGIFLGCSFTTGFVRSGIALYGGAPHTGVENPMSPVVRLDVRVLQLRDVEEGTLVGYGGTYSTPGPRRLATIAAGYADGLPRSLSNCGAAFFEGTRLPMVGRVSMDTTVIDISGLDANLLASGSLVEIIGPSQTIDQLASDAGTIAYEILTRLGRRYSRIYSHA